MQNKFCCHESSHDSERGATSSSEPGFCPSRRLRCRHGSYLSLSLVALLDAASFGRHYTHHACPLAISSHSDTRVILTF
eukprot:3140373-Pleurochrysis_carterae.AAC.2